MGVHPNIGAERFPRQGRDVGTRARVVFNYDTIREFYGTILRSDSEDPFRTVIRLDDGRIILATECQYTPEFLMLPEVRDRARLVMLVPPFKG